MQEYQHVKQKRWANLVDHVEGALEHSIEYLRDLSCYVSAELVDDGCHSAEHLGFSSRWNVPLVINENRFQQRWNKVLPNLKRQQQCFVLLSRPAYVGMSAD